AIKYVIRKWEGFPDIVLNDCNIFIQSVGCRLLPDGCRPFSRIVQHIHVYSVLSEEKRISSLTSSKFEDLCCPCFFKNIECMNRRFTRFIPEHFWVASKGIFPVLLLLIKVFIFIIFH